MTPTTADTLSLRVQAEQIADEYLDHKPDTGRPSLLGDESKVSTLLAAISDGCYLVTACKLSGISLATVHRWLRQAEQGHAPSMAFRDAYEKREAEAERLMVKAVRKAGQLPQYWAAAATHLERRHPSRWARRTDDTSNGPKIVVQIGVSAQDVQVHVQPPSVPPGTVGEE